MPITRRRLIAVAMIAASIAAATAARGEVRPLDPNANEPLYQQINHPTTRPAPGAAADAAAAAEVESLTAEVDRQLQVVDGEVARLRALGESGKARADAIERRAAEIRAMRDAKGVVNDKQPELHVVGVHTSLVRGGGGAGVGGAAPNLPPAQRRRQFNNPVASTVLVEVQPTGRPLVLAVCAYNRTTWDVRIAKDANVQRVIVGGYEQQEITGVPEGVAVEMHTHEGPARSRNAFFSHGPGDDSHANAVTQLRALTQMEIATFIGMPSYDGKPLVVGPANERWVAQRLRASLQPLYRDAIAHTLAQQREAVADVRFAALHFPPVPALPPGARGRAIVNPVRPEGPVLAEFTPRGPIEGTERAVSRNAVFAAVDPADKTVYVIDGHGVARIDALTGRVVPLKLDDPKLPEISWPCGLAFDTKRQRLILATLGGSGMLYAYDPAASKWSGLVDLENVDLASLAYSPAHDRLYGVLKDHGGSGGGTTRLVRYTPEGDADQIIETSRPVLPRGAARPDSMPQLIAVGELLALLWYPSMIEQMRREGPELPPPKCFLIDPKTGDVKYGGIMHPQPAAAKDVTDGELEEAWRELLAEDPATVERAAARLASGGNRAVGFLRAEFATAPPSDPELVRGWIAQLDHGDFQQRDTATRELRRLGGQVEPALREALAAKPSPEAATRIETLLAALAPDAQTGHKLDRDAVAMQVLARIGTPAAIDCLGDLAARIPGAPRTTEARKALREFARED